MCTLFNYSRYQRKKKRERDHELHGIQAYILWKMLKTKLVTLKEISLFLLLSFFSETLKIHEFHKI